ncbi:MAG TPA: UDP-glucose/GDP-mannose dehydrogenase family protein [Nitrospiria bacterium]|jgi:UDPglucose 6-dehydrogenase
MNICVVGTGYVGLVTGACFAEFGNKVVCVDNDETKIRNLKRGILPIYEPGLEEIVRKNSKEDRLSFTTDLGNAIQQSLVIFIAVGTPSREDGSADLSYVEGVAREIASHLNGYKVIVTKSTVPVGTGAKIQEIIQKNKKEGGEFDIVSNPEFLREGSAIEDFMRPNRVVIGTNGSQAIAILKDLYRPLYLIETPFVITDVVSAEMIKYASNAFLATKVSFINEMAALCERVNADVHQVAKGMGLDRRIGSKFLHPGPGFGGSCFPKDTKALTQISREQGYTFEIVEAVIRVNEKQRDRMVEKIRGAVGDLQNKTLGVLGLSFKPNTDDIRESPSVAIIESLLKKGSTIRAFDPIAMDEAKKVLKNVYYGSDAYETAKGCDALILMTEWNQFRNLDLDRIKSIITQPVFIDLRNVYDPLRMAKLGFRYIGVGRKPSEF